MSKCFPGLHNLAGRSSPPPRPSAAMLGTGERPRRPSRDPRVTGRVGRRTPAAPTNAGNTATATAGETAATAGTETAVGATTAAAAEDSVADTCRLRLPRAVISVSGWVLAAKVDSSIRGGCQVGHEHSFSNGTEIAVTLIMVYKSHLIRATLDALDFLEIFQEP